MGRKEHHEKPAEEKDEGPRSFSVFLQSLADGDAHGELGAELQSLVQAVRAQAEYRRKAVAGTLTFTLKVAGTETGMMTVGYEIKAKPPKLKTAESVFWTTKGGNLTPSNPKQPELPIRDVSAPAVTPKDVAEERPVAREV